MKNVLSFLVVVVFNTLAMGQNFELTPATLDFNAEPGESQTKFIQIKNHANTAETFILNVSDYNVNAKGKGEYLEAGSLKQSIADWLSIAPIFFELQPNEEKEIAVTLQMPADEYGSKWGVIFVRTAQEQTAYAADKSLQTGLMVSARMGINVYQTPGSNKTFKATITNLNELDTDLDSTRVYSALVNNLSEVITPCKVYLIATNIETAEEIMFDEMEFVMYPKSSRKIELMLKDILPKGTYSLAAILDYGSKTNLEGAQTIIQVE